MNTDSIVKGTLITIATAFVSTGSTLLLAKDLYGLLLLALGVAVFFVREKLKVS